METTYLDNEIILLEGYKKEGTISHYQNRKLAEYKQIKQLLLHNVSNSAYLCKNVNGEDAIIMAENIADVFDKLEDITPTPEVVEVSGKSTTVYH